ncbi:hypothetical protein KL867_02825 [Ruegeria litorea]|uniref:Lipoprotein n=2 Tax=Falsiruegeria litorea TaxID=1280831 RepID=A0ABS5WLG2_9RHOB|nr:hypothetical protein [Falsiruegeria litorea]
MMKKLTLAVGLSASVLALSACDPSAVSVGGGVYYDSMMWNDYYYGYPNRPNRPDRPDRPKPEHPIARPPVANPPIARPPIHRPPVARPMPGRRR